MIFICFMAKTRIFAKPIALLSLFISLVSMMATYEYENMKEQLDLEQSLRQKAETYAHEVWDKTHLNSPHQYTGDRPTSVPGVTNCDLVTSKSIQKTR